MFYSKLKYDKILVLAAIVVLVIGIFLLPKEAFRFSKTNLVFAIKLDDFMQKTDWENIINEFHENNPGIIIKQSEIEPDVLVFNPLHPEVQNKSSIIEESEPLICAINTLFYNIKLLESNGFDRPPKTRDDFIEICKKIKTVKGVYPLALSSNVFVSIMPWFYQTGLFNETDIKPSGDNAEEFTIDWTSKSIVEIFNFLNVLNTEKLIDNSFRKNSDEILTDFVNGKSAMMINNSTNIKKIKNNSFKFSISSVPTAYRSVLNLRNWNIGVSKNSKHKDEARVFIDYILSKSGEIAVLAGAVPGDLSGTIEERSRNPLNGEIFEKCRDVYEGSQIVDELKLFTDSALLDSVLKDEIQKMWQDKQSPAETAAAVKKRLSK